LAAILQWFLFPDDERALFRQLARHRMTLYPEMIPPGYQAPKVDADLVAGLAQEAYYLAIEHLGPVIVHPVKRGPYKGMLEIEEVPSPVMHLERSVRNEAGELVAGRLWVELNLTDEATSQPGKPWALRRVFEEIHTSGIEDQVTIQSFAWGALNEMHRLAPSWPLVALTNYDFLQVGQPGASPWLGGVDADTYAGDFVKTAQAAIPGLTALSPNYGFPQNGKVSDPGFRFYPSQAMVSEAHARGLKVIPWTCDDPATVEALMDLGVDGIITNYPNHVRQIMADRGMRLPKAYEPR